MKKNGKLSDVSARSRPSPSGAIAQKLLVWYDHARRDLPWRVGANQPGPLNPYRVLVSEFMLQQTQVATVIPYFHRFLARFPTPEALAAAPLQVVLKLWQGLGYYSRARNLHTAAQKIVQNHAGMVPGTHAGLMSLPGVGRYTAGAVASIAFEQPEPIVDGNIIRVLARLDLIRTDPRHPKTLQGIWTRAKTLLPKARVGDFNSALMELGATVCTPKSPDCPSCPLQKLCRAHAAGLQGEIPRPRIAQATPIIRRWTICIERNHRWLIEQRPAKGRWASMWQFIALEPADHNGAPTAAYLSKELGSPIKDLRPLTQIKHTLTHRRYLFEVFTARAVGKMAIATDSRRRWIKLPELAQYPLPLPHAKIAEMLK